MRFFFDHFFSGSYIRRQLCAPEKLPIELFLGYGFYYGHVFHLEPESSIIYSTPTRKTPPCEV